MVDILLAIALVTLTAITARLYFKIVKLQIQVSVVVKSQLETLNLIATLFEKTGEKNATRKTK